MKTPRFHFSASARNPLSETTTQCSGCVATLAKLLVELSIVRKKYLAEYFIFY